MQACLIVNISIHALRKESDQDTSVWPRRFHLFQSTLSVRRATWVQANMPNIISISIHALRKESDLMCPRTFRSPAIFQSTLSVRRATGAGLQCGEERKISIHALRKESDLYRADECILHVNISIHALRKESDASNHVSRASSSLFQSTLSVRRATRWTCKRA